MTTKLLQGSATRFAAVLALGLGVGLGALAYAPAARADWHGNGGHGDWRGHDDHWGRGGIGFDFGFYDPLYGYAPYGYAYPVPYPYGYAYPLDPYPAPVPAYVAPTPMAAAPAGPDYVAPNGQTCRAYQSSAIVNGVQQPVHGTACLQPDGTWRVVN